MSGWQQNSTLLWRGSVQLRMTLRQYDPVSEE